MCGIAGIVGEVHDVQSRMHRMLHALRHRGPDDEGFCFGDNFCLGQRRLSIIDLAGGHQPISNEDSSIHLVANGEIYNYRTIRPELEKLGHHFKTDCDVEVILHLYEEFGEECLKHLQGMFAFAIWDENKKELFAARDHLGQKPLFYSLNGSKLTFGSEIKALLAEDPSLRRLDLESLHQYLALRVIGAPRTMFKNVSKLPPAHLLTFSPERGIEIRRYWSLQYQPKISASEEDLLDELEGLLVGTLRLHMVSDVPVGAFLSGGLDSSLIVALLQKRVLSDPLPTFTVGLPHATHDEAPAARLVAQHCHTSHHERVFQPSMLTDLPKLVCALDEPSDPLSICMYSLARFAREHVKVVLGGDGGDELFGGYDRYYGNRYASAYGNIPKWIRRKLFMPAINKISTGNWYKSVGHQLRWLHELSFFQGSDRYAHSLSYFYFDDKARLDLLSRSARSRLSKHDPYQEIRDPFDSARSTCDLDRMIEADYAIRLPDHPVMITDRMTMAHGLEARSPFMDHRLAEFSARLPENLKIRGRNLRYLQKRLAMRYLPREIIKRPKQGFSSALPYMLRREYEILYRIFLSDSQLAHQGYLSQNYINELVTAHLSGKSDHGNRLWLLVNAEVWFRMYILNHDTEQMEEYIRQESLDSDATVGVSSRSSN